VIVNVIMTLMAKAWLISVVLLPAFVGSACDSPVATPGHAEQRTANFAFTSPTETDRLQVSYPRGSRVWSGFLEVSAKGSTKRIPVSGEVNTEGVPVTITIPSSQVGAADVEFGMFYDSDLNLQLVGNNNIPHPRLMKRVR
jgi:hypothetical protein